MRKNKASRTRRKGDCSNCGYRLLRRYKQDPTRVMIAAVPVVDIDGNTTYVCPKCKSETDIPSIRIKRKVRRANASKATKKEHNTESVSS